MSIMDYLFRNRPKNTASIAKERLQIIVSHERSTRHGPDYLPMLREEILKVIAKYVEVEQNQVKVELERSGNCSILELNITLPDNITVE
jgi:cell division topological specificity factor